MISKKEDDGGDRVGFEYYCDDQKYRMINHEFVYTTWYDGVAGKEVAALEQFEVDCEHVGPNYVLTSVGMEWEQEEDRLRYSYSCATFNETILTCTQFYTDLTEEARVDGSVGSLEQHPVQCYVGSALQMFQYQNVGEEVRYSYHCCTKDPIPTPMPTPYPVRDLCKCFQTTSHKFCDFF